MRTRSIRNQANVETGRGSELVGDSAIREPKVTLSEAEAARYIGMSSGWLKKSRTHRFRNVIDAPPFVRAGAKRVVYRREDLDAWQERHLEQVGPLSLDAPSREAADPTRALESRGGLT